MTAAVNRLATEAKTRIRRSVEDARREILDAAERRLIAGGPDAVRVQTVARDIGLTDAAVHYHFGSREALLESLLRRAGRRLKEELTLAMRRWDPDTLDLAELARLMAETYDAEGHARLSAWLTLAGWKPRGAGMFHNLAKEIHAVRAQLASRRGLEPPPLDDTLFSVELLTLVVWAEALTGDAWRRSVGLPADRATGRRFMEWFGTLLSKHLGTSDGDVGAAADESARK
jgi:AcrR family transcriptional regulator